MSKKLTQEHSLIRAIRNLVGESQTEFGDKLGFSQSKISRIEKGEVSLNQGDASKIAAVLGVDAKLIGGDSDD